MASRFGVIFVEGGLKAAQSIRIALSSPEKQTYQPSWGFSVVAKREKKISLMSYCPKSKVDPLFKLLTRFMVPYLDSLILFTESPFKLCA